MKQGRNGNVGEFRHMTTSFFSTCLIMIKSDSVQDSFWSNHKDVSNSITYEHLRQLPLNNEPRPYRSTSRDFHNLKKMKYNYYSHVPEFTDITIPTLFHYFLQHPFLHYLVIFMKFLPLVIYRLG